MLWQDIVITISSIIFSIALIPQVYYGFREKKGHIAYATSVPTFAGLYVICATYITLHLYSSAIVGFIAGTLWFILFLQRWKYGRQESVSEEH